MRKTKIKERFENAVEAFFDNEKLEGNLSLTHSNQSRLAVEDRLNDSLKKFVSILRQVFLFFPGISAVSGATFFLTCWHFHPNLGFGIFVADYKFFWIYGLLGMILSVLGIGDIRKPKHLAIPASVVLYSTAVGLFFAMSGFGGLDLFNLISVYMLPPALVIPFIVKWQIENDEKDSD